jgi:hypothetical protein
MARGKGNRFGAYLKVGYPPAFRGKRKPTDAGYIGWYHEFGTKHMRARELIETGWSSSPDRDGAFKDVDKTIDEVMKKLR